MYLDAFVSLLVNLQTHLRIYLCEWPIQGHHQVQWSMCWNTNLRDRSQVFTKMGWFWMDVPIFFLSKPPQKRGNTQGSTCWHSQGHGLWYRIWGATLDPETGEVDWNILKHAVAIRCTGLEIHTAPVTIFPLIFEAESDFGADSCHVISWPTSRPRWTRRWLHWLHSTAARQGEDKLWFNLAPWWITQKSNRMNMGSA